MAHGMPTWGGRERVRAGVVDCWDGEEEEGVGGTRVVGVGLLLVLEIVVAEGAMASDRVLAATGGGLLLLFSAWEAVGRDDAPAAEDGGTGGAVALPLLLLLLEEGGLS